MDSRRVQQFDAYVTYTATRTVDEPKGRRTVRIGALKAAKAERHDFPY